MRLKARADNSAWAVDHGEMTSQRHWRDRLLGTLQGQLQLAPALRSETSGAKREPSTIMCCPTPISACEKGRRGQWQPALALLSERLGVKLEPTN